MKTRMSVIVRPDLLRQEKWGIYLVPADQPEMEFMDSCGLNTREEAVTFAKHISERYPNWSGLTFGEEVTVQDNALQPKGEYERVIGDEQTLSDYLADHIKNVFTQLNRLRPSEIKLEPKKWLTSLLTNPITLAIIGILIYYIGFNTNAPGWLEPILPDSVTSSSKLIIAIPLLMFISAVLSVFRFRSLSYQMNTLRNYLLTLILKYNWRFKEFITPILKETGKIELAACLQIVKKLYFEDPDKYNPIMSAYVAHREQIGQAEENSMTGEELLELYKFLLENNFESRVHALLFLEKERWYRPTKIYFNPLNFLIDYEGLMVRWQVVMKIINTGGTVADAKRLHLEMSTFRSFILYLTLMIGFLITNGLIGFALYLGIEEAAKQSSTWLIVAVTCAFFTLSIPFHRFYTVFLRCQGRPRAFACWESGIIGSL